MVFILIALAFFYMCAQYVRGLDRMIGPDAPPVEEEKPVDLPDSEVVES